MANEGFNTFVLGQPAAAAAAATDSVPLIQGGGTKNASVSTITSYYVVGPTGGDDTAMLNSAFATSPSRPVMLSFGQYKISGPLTVPDYGLVVGAGEIDLNDFWQNPQPPRVNLVAQATNSFANNQAIVNVGNYSHIKDFSIFGLRNVAGHPDVHGVWINNKAYPIVEGLYINLCYDGIRAISDGSIAGGSPWGNNSIGSIIRRCFLGYNEEYGFLTYGLNGGFFSDAAYTEVWAASNVSGGMLIGNGSGQCRLVNCRIEDQGLGLELSAVQAVTVVGCQFDRNGSPIILDSVQNASITGCVSMSAGNTGSGSGGTGTHVYFTSRGATNVNFCGNTYGVGAAGTTYTYGVQSPGTVSGAFYENGGGNTAVYQDSYSQSIISPLVR